MQLVAPSEKPFLALEQLVALGGSGALESSGGRWRLEAHGAATFLAVVPGRDKAGDVHGGHGVWITVRADPRTRHAYGPIRGGNVDNRVRNGTFFAENAGKMEGVDNPALRIRPIRTGRSSHDFPQLPRVLRGPH